jgi:hypothetical protein
VRSSGASDTVAGDVLEMTADNFRQCLSRARRDLDSFMNNQCGLVNKSNRFAPGGRALPGLLSALWNAAVARLSIAPANARFT